LSSGVSWSERSSLALRRSQAASTAAIVASDVLGSSSSFISSTSVLTGTVRFSADVPVAWFVSDAVVRAAPQLGRIAAASTCPTLFV